ncbi:hypothetical protein [Ruminiclostridium sufflavum]|nr:hypothetical protein [Ruminiclostridium sufflavum]
MTNMTNLERGFFIAKNNENILDRKQFWFEKPKLSVNDIGF